MEKEKRVLEVTQKELEDNELVEFAETMEEVGTLPKEARRSVTTYAQGIIDIVSIMRTA